MSCEISEALNRLAAEYEHATTQEERDRLWREIARISYSQEADRAKSRRNSRQGAFDAAMLSLDAHMETFDDPSKCLPQPWAMSLEGRDKCHLPMVVCGCSSAW